MRYLKDFDPEEVYSQIEIYGVNQIVYLDKPLSKHEESNDYIFMRFSPNNVPQIETFHRTIMYVLDGRAVFLNDKLEEEAVVLPGSSYLIEKGKHYYLQIVDGELEVLFNEIKTKPEAVK